MSSLWGSKKNKLEGERVEGRQASIEIGRSDGAHLDLGALLSSTDISGIVNEAQNTPNSKPKGAENEDHGKIAVNRSDGVNHCIINVFKGISDAKGETMNRISITENRPSFSSLRPDSMMFPSSVRIVHISDTCNNLSASTNYRYLPAGDILVHSGNFTLYGSKQEYEQFNAWLGSISTEFRYRVVVFGCRDVKELGNNWDAMRKLLPHATHILCHEAATILGVRFYGCPWHWGHHKNYKVRNSAPPSTSGRFEEIPENVQVLVTHGAAVGVLDNSNLPGTKELGDAIRRSKPGLHLHGHSKGSHGMVPAFARYPLVVNSAMCDPDVRVMYAAPHVIRATQIAASTTDLHAAPAPPPGGVAMWNFAMDSLMMT